MGEGDWELREEGGIRWLQAPVGTGSAYFTLASTGDGGRVNLAVSPDGPEAATEARLTMARAIGLSPERFRLVRQVHGGTIRETGGEGVALRGDLLPAREPEYEADGLVSRGHDEVLMVLVADCMPLALSGQGGFALLHLGWRGLATGMLEEAVATVEASYAVGGPCIGPCCFEVGAEVGQALGVALTTTGTVDLVGVASERLRALGVDSMTFVGGCTACETDRFFSHRRQGAAAGRQAALLAGP